MGLIFVPTSDYAATATQAATIGSIDLGYVIAGSSASRSFRIGNRAAAPVTVTLYIDGDEYLPPGLVSLPVKVLTVPANGFSDTLTLTVTTPIDATSSPVAASVLALAGDGSTASLELTWEAVGANTDRRSQYPEHATGFSDNVTAAILRAAEPLRIYRFDPIGYSPEEPANVVKLEPADNLYGWRIVSWQSCEARLDPLNADVGYRPGVQTIMASFQDEEWAIDQQFTRTDTTVTYTGTAKLYIPAEHELPRQWALFAPARGADREQFKRTVYLTQRRGQVWCLQDIVPVFRGAELAYWTVNLIPMSDATMGNPGYYNPFSLTYEHGSDRPYAMFSYRAAVSFGSMLNDIDQSYTPVVYDPGTCSALALRAGFENVQTVTIEATPDVSGFVSLSALTWNVNNAVIKRVMVSTTSQCWQCVILPHGGELDVDQMYRTASLVIAGECEVTRDVDFPYEDRDGTRAVHVYFDDLEGYGATATISILGTA